MSSMTGMRLNGAVRGTGGVPPPPVLVIVPPCDWAVADGAGDGADCACAMPGSSKNEMASASADRCALAFGCMRFVLGGCKIKISL